MWKRKDMANGKRTRCDRTAIYVLQTKKKGKKKISKSYISPRYSLKTPRATAGLVWHTKYNDLNK